MSKLSKDEIAKVARLARIELNESETEQLTTQVASILEFVDALQSVDTEGVEETSQVTGLQDVWREDVVQDCELTRNELLANAPDTMDGYVKVRKIL